uniref:Bax inhibitor 1-like n=1 Tax=Nicotiana tabacum TaxID=4097 RepID=A0A1S4ANK0_TOBAC|nr:PREDICTED: bax inhibitor 1-like [Nicotiana tabacum]
MKFSEMKLHAMNAVKAYFKRDWERKDLTNQGEIPLYAYKCLKKSLDNCLDKNVELRKDVVIPEILSKIFRYYDLVYLTLFCALLSSTVGSFFHLIWKAGGFFTVLTFAMSILFLFSTPPLLVRRRVFFLMAAAFCFGASVGLLTEYLFGIDQGFVFSFLTATTIGFGTFWWGAMNTRQRRLYNRCLLISDILIFIWLQIASAFFGGHTARWKLLVWVVLGWYMGYNLVYSKEVVYDARFGDIDPVNRTFTHLFRLPAIIVHFTRLSVRAAIQRYKQN